MTPLVDVVMVILIFLMCTGSFGAATQYLVSNLPIKSEGVGSPNTEVKPNLDEVNFRVYLDPVSGGGFRARVGDTVCNTLDEVKEALHNKYTQLIEQANNPTDKVEVVIAPHANIGYQTIINVYQAALSAKDYKREGFTKVGFMHSHYRSGEQ